VPNIDHGSVSLADLEGRHFCAVWEAASILEVDRRTIRTACRLGEIPHVRVGTEYKIPVSWLLAAAGQGATR
jgi:excisionase family DNA binding protein